MLPDQDKTREQLIAELAELRLKVNPSRQEDSSSELLESEFRKVNRALKLLIAANQAILSSSTERDLMQAVCSKCIEAGGYKMAWVGFAVQDENKTVRPVAWSGDEDNYLSTIVISWADNELGHGPTGTAIRTGKPFICKNIATDPRFAPWRTEAAKRGYGSNIGIPLIAQSSILGALTIYAPESVSFDEPELSLLTELADSLAFAIVSLRARAAREKVEKALHTSEDRFSAVAHSLADAIIISDEMGEIVFWTPAAENIFGYTAEEAIGLNSDILRPEQYRAANKANRELFIKTGSSPFVGNAVEGIALKKNGMEFPVEVATSSWKESGHYIFCGIVRDITERKKAQKALAASEERYRSLFMSAGDAIYTINQQGKIISWNKSAEAIYGYAAEEIIGKDFLSLIPEQYRSEHEIIFQRAMSAEVLDNITGPVEGLGRKKDGAMLPLESSLAMCNSWDGNYCTVIVRDITDRKTAAAELEKYRHHLEDLVATRTTELSGVNLQLQHEIDEHRKTEDALRRSEEQFRSVIETASDAIVSADSSGNVILWNRAAENIFGYTAEEMLNKPFLRIMPEQLQETHWQQFASFMAESKPGTLVSHAELRARRKDGSEFCTEGSAALWKTKDGVFITSIIRDISERKRAEEKLHESEERFRNLAQTALDAIFLTDENRRIIFWNKSAERIFGYPEHEALGRISSFVVPDELREQDEAGFQRIVASGYSPVLDKFFESRGRHRDGTIFPTEVSFSTWQSQGKNFFCLVARDVTERKRAEAALRESEAKFRTMTESITASIFIYQGNHLVYVNPAAVKTCGYTSEELLSMYFWEIIHPDFIEQVREWGRRRQAGEELPSRYELKIKTGQGAERWVDYTAAAITYNDGAAVLGTAIDITERKLAENALRESEEKYRLTAEHVPFHIAATDQSYKYVLWNKHSEKMFGYTAEEVIHKISPSAMHASKKDAEKVITTINDKGIFDDELNLRRKDGSVFPAHLVVVPDKNGQGNITGLHGFAEDITQRKRTAELIKTVNDCLLNFTADPDKNIQSIVTVAGTILNGSSASYHKKRGDLLHISVAWNLPKKYMRAPRTNTYNFDDFCAYCGDGPFIINNFDELPHVPKDSPMLQMGYKALIATPIRVSGALLGSLNVAFKEARNFSPNEQNIFSILAKAINIEEERKKVLEDLRQHQQKLKISEKNLKAFSGRILSIREEEQKNISSSLHDEIGSMVVSVSSGLTIAKDDITENNPEAALKSIENTEAALRLSVNNLKKVALDLRPPNLDIVGLSNALNSFFLNFSQQTRLTIDFSTGVKDNKLDEARAIVLYRTAQEALNNIVKHAKATTVSIRLYEVKNSIAFDIADNGRGFNPESLSASSRAATRIGLQGMQERIAALGGTLHIESAPQKGTTLHITIPKGRGKRDGNKSYSRR